MKRSLIYPALITFFLIAFGASGAPVQFDTLSHNFQLAGGGGGDQATLSGTQLEFFGDDFTDTISATHDYLADVTTLSTTANLDETRFGEVSSTGWTKITLTDHTAAGKQDQSFFNSGAGTGALARYEMSAFLVSLYNVGGGNAASNNQIQEAIWSLLDPTRDGKAPNPTGANPTAYLEEAASWYSTMNTAANRGALNAFLGNYEIVSDPTMKYKRGLGIGGFQEQIVDPPARQAPVLCATPEPRGGIWMVIGLFVFGGFLLQRARGVHRAN